LKLHRPRTYWRMLITPLTRGAYMQGEFRVTEPAVWRMIKKQHGALFVDVGANIGMYSIVMAKRFERVVSFEAFPPDYEGLRKNIMTSPKAQRLRILARPEAVSDGSGLAEFWLDESQGRGRGSANTLLKDFEFKPTSNPTPRYYTGTSSIMVRTVSLDDTFLPHGDTSLLPASGVIDLLKIDVEGGEFLVLQGARLLLKQKRVKNVVVELHNVANRNRLMGLFLDAGYDLRWLDDDHLHAWPKK